METEKPETISTDPEGYRIIVDPVYGYRRLDPLPDDNELSQFYESQYYDLIAKQGRAPEIRRLMAGGQEAESERAWLAATLYTDIEYVLKQHARGKRVLDVGCGTGELIAFLNRNGFAGMGIEPAQEAVVAAEAAGLMVREGTLEQFVDYFYDNNMVSFDAVTLLNVLEHVRNPVRVVEDVKNLLGEGGILCVRVPQDFTELQLAAQLKLGCSPWWIAVPDHINYFDARSLQTFLSRLGFEIIYVLGDFPMELFLLMGDVYVGNPEVGGQCHQRRVRFESALPADFRRRIYETLARVGVGRDILVFAKKKSN